MYASVCSSSPYTWLTPCPPTMVCQMFIHTVTTWPLLCTVWLHCVRQRACVCLCVRQRALSNRWSNLIHVSFLPRCPLALMVCWWCYLGLTSILSALFLESTHPASQPPAPTLLRLHRRRPVSLGHPDSDTLVPQEQLVRWSWSQVTWDRLLCGGVKCVWKNNILFTVNEQMLLLLKTHEIITECKVCSEVCADCRSVQMSECSV